MKLYMFRTVRLSSIRSLFTVHSAMLYVIQVCRQLLSRTIWPCSTAVYKPVWHIPLLSVQWINSWWWTDELSETCRVSYQNKFVKSVHLIAFIIKKNIVHRFETFTLKKMLKKMFWLQKQKQVIITGYWELQDWTTVIKMVQSRALQCPE